jgi:XTP/dITP diphosphohydrolase
MVASGTDVSGTVANGTGTGAGDVVLLATGAFAPVGALTARAWDLLRGPADVCCASADHPLREALAEAGVTCAVLPIPDDGPPGGRERALAATLAERAQPGVRLVYLLDVAGEPELAEAVAAAGLSVETVVGSWDPPGAAMLAAAAVMDRLRSPGGCPWDAEQTHTSLAPYLIEEAYEAYQALEDGDSDGLREELGDVLMQVLFHARIASERGAEGWTIDDVAADLVDKLVRRHPHVFGEVSVDGPDAVVANWEKIKAVEKGRRSVTEGVPLSQPALTLTAKLYRKARKLGIPDDLAAAAPARPSAGVGVGVGVERGVGAEPRVGAEAGVGAEATEDLAEDLGRSLFANVVLAQRLGIDPETALRALARRYRDTIAGAEEAARAAGDDPAALDAAGWRSHWP